MTKQATVKQDHAKDNAAAWVSTLAQMVAALECDYYRLQELRNERETLVDQSDDTSAECFEARKELAAWDADHGEELRELTKSATIDDDLMADAESARERIQESPLSVQVRSGWRSVGDDHGDHEEFEILLSTGGPALRIRGELGAHCEPSRAWLEYQDWGTVWTQYFDVEQTTLLTYCSVFYFGE